MINMTYDEDEFLLTTEDNEFLIKRIIEIVDLNKQSDDCVTIFCHYIDCNIEIYYDGYILDGYIFFIEICNHKQPLLKRCVKFANKSEMIALAVLIYDKFKENFGEAGFSYRDDSIGRCFASGSVNFDLEKGTGINYVCYGIDYCEFVKTNTKVKYFIK
ncbi:MAG: hypothetical protein PHN42_03725 [Bacilli bacterium]|nr:hypothetical protein [Bacilli bacterium]